MEKIGKYITGYVKGKTPKVLYDSKQEDTLPYLSIECPQNESTFAQLFILTSI